jgi:hypothetical protein
MASALIRLTKAQVASAMPPARSSGFRLRTWNGMSRKHSSRVSPSTSPGPIY